MNSLDKQYQDLLQTILDYGVEKKDRTGTGTKSIFGYTIRHDMSEGFPVLTTKKMAWKTMVTELLWFLRGDTNIKFLVDNNCHIWDGDAYKNFCNSHTEIFVTQEEFIERIKDDDEFAKKWGELGPIYGKQWRKWKTENYKTFYNQYGYEDEKRIYIDQIANLINDLKTNPDSRRLMVSAWNPADLEASVLPPCHYGFQVYTRELSLEERRSLVSQEVFNKIYNGGGPDTLSHSEINQWNIPTRAISLMYNARSQDVPLGTPFNLASYGLLLMILAKEVNMVPEELITNMGDCHIYLNQIDGVKEQLTREPFELPTLNPFPTYEGSRPSIESYTIGDFTLKNYKSHPSIKMPLSN
jgi:thymidylate synthase